MWTNFEAYGLQPPVGLMRADSHLPPFRPGLQEVVDAIICDPPYGVRLAENSALNPHQHLLGLCNGQASWLGRRQWLQACVRAAGHASMDGQAQDLQ